MFDTVSEQTIRSAPALDELDIERLPESLTKLYTEISALRLTLVEGGEIDHDFKFRLARLARLSHTYALLVACRIDDDKYVSASLVAGFGFRLLAQAQLAVADLELLSSRRSPMQCSDWHVAIILFLIAGYPADALATVRLMKAQETDGTDLPDHQLTRSLEAFAEARLSDAVVIGLEAKISIERLDLDGATDFLEDQAERVLYLRLAEGCGELANVILNPFYEEKALSAKEIFIEVLNFSYASNIDDGAAMALKFTSTFAGPYFAALLLIRLAEDLPARNIQLIPPPSGVPTQSWRKFLHDYAQFCPFLWNNHKEAIQSGYLNTPHSAVITLPTGAGKTWLSILKIAVNLLQQRKVIFLAPTHALCGQICQELRRIFADFDVRESIVDYSGYAEVGEEDANSLSDLTVMTPERCLYLADLYPTAFSEVGVVIMDECHLLHPSKGVEDQRALDAMLCLLQILRNSNSADVLLMSAMIENDREIADWLCEVTTRPCAAIRLAWKPTRQARGCLVFRSSDISALRTKVKSVYQNRTTTNPPTMLKNSLRAMPYGFFGLHRLWDTLHTEDYHLAQISPSGIPLGINARWQITTDKNSASAHLCAQAAQNGFRVIVFSQNKAHCESIQNKAVAMLSGKQNVQLTEQESRLREAAISEAGGEQYAYLPTPEGIVLHHGLLNPVERELAEALFRRKDGAKVIVASPTLAQGMNLPAEMVILAGELRFNQSTNSHELVEAHELLNAAGRAGRAGHYPEGVVLVVPGSPIAIDVEEHTIGPAWMQLQDSIFAKDDRCLTLNDPLEYLLDKIENADSETPRLVKYLINRLPVDDEGWSAADRVLSRSFAGFRAKRRGEQAKFISMIDTISTLQSALLEQIPDPTWINRVASANGIPSNVVQSLSNSLAMLIFERDWTLRDWVKWMFSWLKNDPSISLNLLRFSWLEELFPVGYCILRSNQLSQECMSMLESLTQLWIHGASLREIEEIMPCREFRTKKFIPTPPSRIGKCRGARKFTQRVSSDLAFIFGLIPQVWRCLREDNPNVFPDVPLVVAVGSTCIRRGVSNPAVLAMLSVGRDYVPTNPIITRRQAFDLYEQVKSDLGQLDDMLQFKDIISATARALKIGL